MIHPRLPEANPSSVLLLGLAMTFFGSTRTSMAEVRLPALFSDHMVLQRGPKAPVWGWADRDEEVTVTFAGRSAKSVGDDNGRWRVEIGPLEIGKCGDMTIVGTNLVTVQDVLVGEVWVCGGQSNMATALQGYADEDEISAAANPQLRLFMVGQQDPDEPAEDCQGQWQRCEPSVRGVGRWGANPYYFGKSLHEALEVPVGLIQNAFSGSAGEAWANNKTMTRPEYADFVTRYREARPQWEKDNSEWKRKIEQYRKQRGEAVRQGRPLPTYPRAPLGAGHPRVHPAGPFNGMVFPLAPYRIQGVIWWQGESNSGRGREYQSLLTSIIADWREVWGQGDFTFIIGQLQNTGTKQTHASEGGMAWIRESMLKTSLTVPNAPLVVACDIGDAENTHFQNKRESGRRLALAARGTVYNEDVVHSGPIYDTMTVDGNSICLRFKHVGGGLVLRDGLKCSGFAIAGANQQFVWAEAKVDGHTVVVSADSVEEPVAVRYAWASNPYTSLFNKAGLPASPFRTDDWER